MSTALHPRLVEDLTLMGTERVVRDRLDEFAAAVRGQATPETGGEYATRSLGVIRAGVISAREGRRVQLAEVLADPNA